MYDLRNGTKINKAAKGQRKERQIEQELRKEGFTKVWRSIRVRYQNNDFFKLFDVVAYNPCTKEMRMIQSKYQKVSNDLRDEISKLDIQKITKWIYIWRDYKSPIKEYYE